MGRPKIVVAVCPLGGGEEVVTKLGDLYSSSTETADCLGWLLSKKVPSCGFFWDLFIVMVSMKPKKFSRKESHKEQTLKHWKMTLGRQ
jgi:hypothetical protein